MKKLIAMMLAVMLVLGLCACGSEVSDEEVQLQITAAPQEAESETAADVYAFVYEGVKLVPGEAFDAAQLPEAQSVYEVPSCAIEGTDNVYNYGSLEVTAVNDGSGEYIYSVFILDGTVSTVEGLTVGDDEAKIVENYGEGYEGNGTEYRYTKGETQLSILVEDGKVISIEFRQAV